MEYKLSTAPQKCDFARGIFFLTPRRANPTDSTLSGKGTKKRHSTAGNTSHFVLVRRPKGLPKRFAPQRFLGRGGATKLNLQRRLHRCMKCGVCTDDGRTAGSPLARAHKRKRTAKSCAFLFVVKSIRICTNLREKKRRFQPLLSLSPPARREISSVSRVRRPPGSCM